jgi:hypothetical protein
MKRYGWQWVAVGAVVLGLWCFSDTLAQEKKATEKQPNKKSLVAQKLEHAQKVLAGVAQTDYSVVQSECEALIQNSKDLAWQQIRSERYEELGKEYRNELQGLIKAAKAKNNEAMALGYVKVSLACFNCHNHVREIKISQ